MTMESSKRVEFRNKVSENIIRELLGPKDGPEEILNGKTFWRYMSGMLFPQGTETELFEESDEPDSASVGDESKLEDKSLEMAYECLPSSMGISFFVAGAEKLMCRIQAGIYTKYEDADSETEVSQNQDTNQPTTNEKDHKSDDGSEKWKRNELSNFQDTPEEIPIPNKASEKLEIVSVLDGKAEFRAFSDQEKTDIW